MMRGSIREKGNIYSHKVLNYDQLNRTISKRIQILTWTSRICILIEIGLQ